MNLTSQLFTESRIHCGTINEEGSFLHWREYTIFTLTITHFRSLLQNYLMKIICGAVWASGVDLCWDVDKFIVTVCSNHLQQQWNWFQSYIIHIILCISNIFMIKTANSEWTPFYYYLTVQFCCCRPNPILAENIVTKQELNSSIWSVLVLVNFQKMDSIKMMKMSNSFINIKHCSAENLKLLSMIDCGEQRGEAW